MLSDHLGPAEFSPDPGIAVRPHPHTGLAAVTWLSDGACDHRDSFGTVQTIYPGAVNAMTADRGFTQGEQTHAPIVQVAAEKERDVRFQTPVAAEIAASGARRSLVIDGRTLREVSKRCLPQACMRPERSPLAGR